jgi:ferredoxin
MMDPGADIRIDRETCVVCGACAAACPTEALVVEGLTLTVVPERCRPCGQAALVCPTGALRCPTASAKRAQPDETRL